YLGFIAEEPDVYRFLVHQSPPDRPRAATHGSGFSRMIADSTPPRPRGGGGGPPPPAWAGPALFVGGLEAAASRWVEEPTGTPEDLADRLTGVLWNGFETGGAGRWPRAAP